MYNGNGNGNGYNTNSSGGFRGPRINTAGYTSIGSMRVRSVYLYIALAVVGVLLLYFLINFVQTSLVMHFSMFAGVLLLLTNLRELIGSSFAQRSSTSLLGVTCVSTSMTRYPCRMRPLSPRTEHRRPEPL